MEECENVRTKKQGHTDADSEQSNSDEQYEEDSDSNLEDEGDEHQMYSDDDDEEEDDDNDDDEDLEEEDGEEHDKHMKSKQKQSDDNSDQEDEKSDDDFDDEASKDEDESGEDESSPGRTKKRKITQDTLDLTSIKGKDSKKPTKPGIIYLSRVPPFMKPKKLNFIFGQYGEIGRIFLQQEDKSFRKIRKKKGGNKSRSYTEGWIEFKKKKIAKRVAVTFNNTRIGDRKRSRYYDDLWNIKYLPRFQWAHLMERIEYEKQVRQQRIRTEVMQSKKETNFYLKNVEQQKMIDRMKTKKSKQGKDWDFQGRNFKQWKTEEERKEDQRMLQQEMGQRSGKVTPNVLGKIFKK
ncbi:uncharacterized protein [Amphiura filiformis]|uniref:uncharacterized protein n=1 Tax=Amphiura filiformis TaxID=82378 RepID=UPI003B21A68E